MQDAEQAEYGAFHPTRQRMSRQDQALRVTQPVDSEANASSLIWKDACHQLKGQNEGLKRVDSHRSKAIETGTSYLNGAPPWVPFRSTSTLDWSAKPDANARFAS
jgi:hypothetical protein